MSEPANNSTPESQDQSDGKEITYTQEEVNDLLSKAAEKAVAKVKRGIPTEEELTAFRAWKESQQTEKEKWDGLTKERDDSKAALSAAQTELEQLKRERMLLSKGIPAEDVDYYAYKIGKLVTDTTPFEKAAEEFLKKEKPPGTIKVDFTAPLGGGKPQSTPNEQMNNIFRSFRK